MKSYSLNEIAESLGVHERTVREWIDSGELRAINASRSRTSQKPRLRVLDADLQAFLASRSVGREEKPAPRRRKRATDVKEFF